MKKEEVLILETEDLHQDKKNKGFFDIDIFDFNIPKESAEKYGVILFSDNKGYLKFLKNRYSNPYGFVSVNDYEPPTGVELLARCPNGTTHLCSWRATYGIFTCQNKIESTWGWSWKLI